MDNPTPLANQVSTVYQQILRDLNVLSQTLSNMGVVVPGVRLSPQESQSLIDGLPRLQEQEVIDAGEKDNFCPICFVPYLAVLAEEEMAQAMDSPAHPIESTGVTKLSQAWQCGHMFCRRDISKWISEGHVSCPMCRRSLLQTSEPTQLDVPSQLEEASQEPAVDPFPRLRELQRVGQGMASQTNGLVQIMQSIVSDLATPGQINREETMARLQEVQQANHTMADQTNGLHLVLQQFLRNNFIAEDLPPELPSEIEPTDEPENDDARQEYSGMFS